MRILLLELTHIPIAEAPSRVPTSGAECFPSRSCRRELNLDAGPEAEAGAEAGAIEAGLVDVVGAAVAVAVAAVAAAVADPSRSGHEILVAESGLPLSTRG